MKFNWINDDVCVVEGLDKPLRYEANPNIVKSREVVEHMLGKVAHHHPRATVFTFEEFSIER